MRHAPSHSLHPLATNMFLLTLGCVAAFLTCATDAVCTRKYYVAIQEVEWDYSGGVRNNLLNLQDQASAATYFETSSERIGSVYIKAMYFGYTDASFKTQVPKPNYMGLWGPKISGEVGDTLEVVFFNNGSRPYSMHPHGVFYLKEHESAIYRDGTSGRFKLDDIVFPGDQITLHWIITPDDAPGENDPNCIPWVYHSHVDTGKDTSAGLMGPIITCRQGVLDDNNNRIDVANEFPLLVKIFDENLSWFIDDNARKCAPPNKCLELLYNGDEDFTNSNYKASLNGLMFGHLSGLETCLGDRTAFYVIGMGNELDVHSIHFHGQELEYQNTRGDTISVFSQTFVASETTPTKPGLWLIADMVDPYRKNGLGAFWITKNCTDRPYLETKQGSGVTRHYYMTAEEVDWNYGPAGVDARSGKALTDPTNPSSTYFEKGPQRVGGQYKKAQFFEYTDSTFNFKVDRSSGEDYLGILGPVIRLEVGDTVTITLINRISYPILLLPHGLKFPAVLENKGVDNRFSGGKVNPGATFTYEFYAPEDLLDGSKEPCRNYLYTSAFDPVKDHNSGLVGPIVVCRRGSLSSIHGKDSEKFLLFTTFDENESLFFNDNIAGLSATDADPGFQESNLMFSINGYSFGNMPVPTSCLDEDVTWYVMALGSSTDVHTASFDGNAFELRGKHRDVQSLVAGSTAALRMKVDNPGKWLIQSHSNFASTNGMYAFYKVDETCGNSNRDFQPSGKQRVYYIAAVEVEWDYAPMEKNLINGADLNDPRDSGNVFVKDDEVYIGDVYKKAIFREFTDDTFTTRKQRSQREIHLDILGPVIRAEVGDVIIVYFKNLASRPYSMHAQGVLYDSDDSGVNYVPFQSIDPHQTKLYEWEVPKRSGPGPEDPNCIPWLYYSAVDIEKDTYSGLVGGLTICRPGTLDDTGKLRLDIDREFFLLMSVFEENKSWYFDENIKNHAPALLDPSFPVPEDFEESNKMHAVNGRLFANNEDLCMEFNETIAWYFFSIGAEIDLHTFHLHGHTVLSTSEKHRDDSLAMFPGMAESYEMIADNPGTWILHCHTLDHLSAGMETTYTVLKPNETVPVIKPLYDP